MEDAFADVREYQHAAACSSVTNEELIQSRCTQYLKRYKTQPQEQKPVTCRGILVSVGSQVTGAQADDEGAASQCVFTFTVR